MGYTVFVHSHKFRRINGKIYSPGGLPNDVLTRYTNWYGKIKVIARIIDEKNVDKKFSEINNKNVEIINYLTTKQNDLNEIIKNAERIILRVPCNISNRVFKIAKNNNKVIISEVVGCAFDSLWNYSIIGKLIAPIAYIKTKQVVKGSDGVIYVTEKFLQKRYPTNKRNSFCSDVCIEPSNIVLEKRINKISSKKNNMIVIGTCGAIDVKYKGQKYVIKAIAKLRKKGYNNFFYEIAGGGKKDKLEALIKKYKLENNIRILGSIPHNKINDFYDKIDVYIQPSNTEGLCRALVEAMSRGCPCIASDAGGNPELINSRWIFRKKNSTDLMDKIEKLTSDDKIMIESSKTNFKKSNEFSENILDSRRNNFYNFYK